jgi:hypothetical protein
MVNLCKFAPLIFILLISCSTKEKQFINAERHQNNLLRLREMNSQMLDNLSKYGVNENSGISLDFFFVTDDSMKPQSLATDLGETGYHVNRIHASPKDESLWVLTGNAPMVNMDSSSLNKWTSFVCETGYKNDCELQGWSPVTE